MPAKGQIARPLHLREGLLYLVFSEVDLSAVSGGPDVVGGERLRDGDEPDGGWIAPGSAGRPRDSIADIGQPGPERGGIEHYDYFFSASTNCFASGAFLPVGASFRYVSNSVTAFAGSVPAIVIPSM